MEVDLFAGIPVRDYMEGSAWYKRLGSEPSFEIGLGGAPLTPAR
jgi:hypothetical protein